MSGSEAPAVEAEDGSARCLESQEGVDVALPLATEKAADGVLVVDSEGKIVRYNRRFLALWNIPAEFAACVSNERLISFVLDRLVDPGTFLRVTRENQEDPCREYFCRLRFKDGRVIERFSRPQLRKGEIVGRILRFRDVSEEVCSEGPSSSVVRLEEGIPAEGQLTEHVDEG